jgi:hypothetical protein
MPNPKDHLAPRRVSNWQGPVSGCERRYCNRPKRQRSAVGHFCSRMVHQGMPAVPQKADPLAGGRCFRVGPKAVMPAMRYRASQRHSEIWRVRLWGRIQALIEVIPVVLGANHFVERDFRGTLVTPVTLNRVPCRRKGARILHPDIDH